MMKSFTILTQRQRLKDGDNFFLLVSMDCGDFDKALITIAVAEEQKGNLNTSESNANIRYIKKRKQRIERKKMYHQKEVQYR
jgi:hypothetical protein